MRNALKKTVGLGAAVLAVVVAVGVCQAAVYINLSLSVNETAKTWKAYATLTDASSETLGLHGIGLDVWGSGTEFGAWDTGGISANDGTDPLGGIVLPNGVCPTYFWTIGFGSNQQAGTVVDKGVELMAAMQPNLHQTRTISSVVYNSIAQGVGESSGSTPALGGSISWTAPPVLVAEGTYTGVGGWLNVALRKNVGTGEATSVTVLPSSLPTPTTGGASFSTFSPLAGDNYRVSYYIIPEPATLALLGLGGLGLILSRKRR